MPTDTVLSGSSPRNFALRLIAWSLALFGLLRLPWVAAHIVLPVTRLQAAAGSALVGPSSLPVEATLACSGADALALCLAAIVAYPARWRMRAVGVGAGAAGILVLNTIRIGTLGRVVASPRWFEALHVYVWPAVLTLAIAGFVFAWMRAADPHALRSASAKGPVEREAPRTMAASARTMAHFALLATTLLIVFTLSAPLYLESARVLAVAGLVARAAARLLRMVGMDATSGAGVLATPRGAFLVTQECISTPLIPIYLAAVVVYSRTRWQAVVWTAAGVPLFVALGIARLLVVALPDAVDSSPTFLIHAFSQLLVGAAMVCGVAFWRHGARASTYVRAIAALALGVAFVRLLGPSYTHAILWFRPALTAFDDPQGALRFLPAFQLGLFLALWVAAFGQDGWTRLACGAALLAAVQLAVDAGVQLIAAHAGVAPHVRDIRAWALVGPALIIMTVVNVAPSRR